MIASSRGFVALRSTVTPGETVNDDEVNVGSAKIEIARISHRVPAKLGAFRARNFCTFVVETPRRVS